MKIIKKVWTFYGSRPYLGLLTVLIILLINLLTDINYPYFPRTDSGAHIIAAKAIAIGKGYLDISNPWDAPFTLYPPVFSLILALPISLWGINYLAMKICVALFAVGSVIILYFIFKKFLDLKIVPLLLLILIFSGFYNYSIIIKSEMPFIFFSLVSIFFMERYVCSAKVLTIDLLGVLLFLNLSQFTKLVGFSLTVAAIFYVLIKNPLSNLRSQFRLKICKVGLIILLTMVPFCIYLSQVNPWYVSKKSNPYLTGKSVMSGKVSSFVYQKSKLFNHSKNTLFYYLPKCLVRDDLNAWIELDKKILPPEAIRNGAIGNYWRIPGEVLFNSNWPVRKELSLCLLLMLFIVFVMRIIRCPDFMTFYFLIYLIIILTSPWQWEIPRYVVPIIPLCIFYLYQGLVSVGALLRTMGSKIVPSRRFILNPQVFSCAVLMLLFGFGLLMGFNKHYNGPQKAARRKSILRQCEWVKMNTSREDVILCVDKYIMYLYTGRKAFSFVPWERRKEHYRFGLDSYLRMGGQIDYIICSKSDTVKDWIMDLAGHYGLMINSEEEVYKDFIVIKLSKGINIVD